MIDDGLVEDLRNDVARIFQGLQPLDARKILRHDLYNLHSGDLFLQAAADTSDGTAGSDARDEMRQLAIPLRNDFGGGRVEV